MLKVRLSGSKKDIRWFLKGLQRDTRYEVSEVSDFKPFEKDVRFRRLYINILRKDKKKSH